MGAHAGDGYNGRNVLDLIAFASEKADDADDYAQKANCSQLQAQVELQFI